MTELSIIGLMSGTSADGIDAAVLITDGVQVTRTASCGHFAYRQDTRERYGPVQLTQRCSC